MSNHVGSRWYRAPEVILCQNQYDQAIDMWSVGCIIHEILISFSVHQKSILDREERVMFPGDSSFPLSPRKIKSDENTKQISTRDQMRLILQKLGPQSDEDVSFFNPEKLPFIQNLQSDVVAQDLGKYHAAEFHELTKVMKGCLEFNPYFRSSATECLQSSAFDHCRETIKYKSPKCKLILDIDRDDAFNYETGLSEKYTLADY